MIRWREVGFDDPDARALRSQMSVEMNELYGRPGAAPEPDAGIDPADVIVTIVGDDAGQPVATATVRRLGLDLELKRMYVVPDARGRGLASALLTKLENRAQALGAPRLVLHTGKRQTAAIELYRARGYTPIPVLAPYRDVPESLCFVRRLHVVG
ncbi:GNAT family N-acetyltransferase [uncultured Aeromicrobium sp.]|uniref:GNAT family N-acetyltransferase n=1 Tax=uncultured Aeromicrobium sp. TaxID=337820 RepID=UPI0025DF78D2|nr:GNAT family N-acetyltransferase [uncultured Aeromicrobium sp.]